MSRYQPFPVCISRWPDSPRDDVYALQERNPVWHLLYRASLTTRIPVHRPLHWRPAWVPLAGVCRDQRVVLVHTHFGPAGLVAVPLARALRVPLVVTFHGGDVTRWPLSRSFRDAYRRVLFRRANLMIAVSDFVRQRLIELGAPPAKVVRHYIGVPTRLFRCSDRPRAADSALRLLSVGRLVDGKGHDVLVRALSALVRSGVPVTLVLIGDGPRRAFLESLVRELGVADVVRFAGWRPPDAVTEAMRMADVFVMPSITARDGWVEGLGLAQLEAAASGLPVVASRVGGIPETVADGVTGYLVPEKEPAALADRIGTLAADCHLRERMGRAGRTRVEQHFDLAQQTAELEGLYDRILGTQSALGKAQRESHHA